MTEGGYKQFCPVAMAADILCTRWTVVLLREMVAGSTRFNDLRRGVPRMSPALLSKRLKDLETAGIVTRSPVAGESDLYEYRLTRSGKDLAPIIEAVGVWGHRWIETEASLANLDPNLLMWDMRRNINPAPLPRRAEHNPGHPEGSSGAATEMVAGRRAGQGGRSLLGRSRVRRRPFSVDRPQDHDRNLDGLYHRRARQGAAKAGHDRGPAAGSRHWKLVEAEPLRKDRQAGGLDKARSPRAQGQEVASFSPPTARRCRFARVVLRRR